MTYCTCTFVWTSALPFCDIKQPPTKQNTVLASQALIVVLTCALQKSRTVGRNEEHGPVANEATFLRLLIVIEPRTHRHYFLSLLLEDCDTCDRRDNIILGGKVSNFMTPACRPEMSSLDLGPNAQRNNGTPDGLEITFGMVQRFQREFVKTLVTARP